MRRTTISCAQPHTPACFYAIAVLRWLAGPSLARELEARGIPSGAGPI